MTDDGALRAAVAEAFPRLRRELERLVAIPSVSAAGHGGDALQACADTVGAVLAGAGFTGVRHLEVAGAPPYVYAELEGADASAPTVLLYAHYDVQPAGDPGRWTSPPFVPTERDGRLYGRGAADNKAAVVLHAAAAGAWLRTAGAPPVNLKVLVEGEEEIGSPNLRAFLDAAAPLLQADVVVLPDAAAWDTGWPALTWSLRGLAELTVTLRSLRRPLHSGVWGGAAPDAIAAMARLIASLHDDDGGLAVAGAHDGVVDDAQMRALVDALPVEALAEQAGLMPGARWVGDSGESVFEKVWLRPSVTVVGLDVPPVRDASNQVTGEVRAKLSLRSAPGQDMEALVDAVAGHLRAHVPWGATLDVRHGPRCPAWSTRPDGPAVAAAQRALETAYGRRPALVGGGGTIPFVGAFSAALGGVPCLLPGLGDPYMNAHAEDESMHLADLRKAFLAEALLLAELADRAGELRAAGHATS